MIEDQSLRLTDDLRGEIRQEVALWAPLTVAERELVSRALATVSTPVGGTQRPKNGPVSMRRAMCFAR